MPYKIMLIEDDEKLASLVAEHLGRYAYEIFIPSDLRQVLEAFEREKPHLVLMDVNLPYWDGFYLSRAIREKSKVPIIMLSARNGAMDQVLGVEMGADDYLTKPFDLEILVSKIKAAIRRVYGEYAENGGSALCLHGLALDDQAFRILYRSESLELTKNEFRLLKAFLTHPDRVVSRETLLSAIWDDASFVSDNTLTVNVARIKTKCEELGIPELIKTKRGVGYYLDTAVLKEG